MESVTHGGRAKEFKWVLVADSILIIKQSGVSLNYNLLDIQSILSELNQVFGLEWFPLANNVEKLYLNEEVFGLGTALYRSSQSSLYAQGASYLGVVLESGGILEWNGEKRGIQWRLIRWPLTLDSMKIGLVGSISSVQSNEIFVP